jgi:hypothetical protein
MSAGPVLATPLLLLLSSCGLTDRQRNAVRSFGQSAHALSQFTEAELPRMRHRLIEINSTMVRLVGEEDADLGAKDTVTGVAILNLDGALNPETIKAALQAVQGLAGYAAALSAVVDYDSERDLKEAADRLSQSIKGVEISGRALLEDEQADALADTIRQLGGMFVERKRATVVRSIVATYRPLVPELVALLTKSFDPTSGSGGLAVEVSTRAKDLAVAAKAVMRRETSPDPERRERTRGAEELATENLRQQELLATHAAAAFARMASANDTMARVLENDEIGTDEIRAFYGAVVDLLANVEVLARD